MAQGDSLGVVMQSDIGEAGANGVANYDATAAALAAKLPIYGKGRNLLDNAYFGNADSIIDQRGGYVLTDTATYYTDTALTQDPVTVSAYTTMYFPDVHTNYVGFYLTNDPTGTKYYASRTDCVRGYALNTAYSIDRWKIQNTGVVLILSDGVRLINTSADGYFEWQQKLAFPTQPRSHTISALIGNANVGNSTSFIYCDGSYSYRRKIANGLVSGEVIHSTSANILAVRVGAGDSFDIKGIFLEEGAVQTGFTNLGTEQSPNWVPSSIPDYGEELAKCQRYQWIMAEGSNVYTYPALGEVVINSSTDHRLRLRNFTFPTTMRIAPTIKILRLIDVTSWPTVELTPVTVNFTYGTKDGINSIAINEDVLQANHIYNVLLEANANL